MAQAVHLSPPLFDMKDIADSVRQNSEKIKRLRQSEQIRQKYPDRIPVFCEPEWNTSVPNVDKNRFLVPQNLSVSEFLAVIRKRINVNSNFAMSLYVDGNIPNGTELMSCLYDKHAADDGFLYVTYKSESTFG